MSDVEPQFATDKRKQKESVGVTNEGSTGRDSASAYANGTTASQNPDGSTATGTAAVVIPVRDEGQGESGLDLNEARKLVQQQAEKEENLKIQ